MSHFVFVFSPGNLFTRAVIHARLGGEIDTEHQLLVVPTPFSQGAAVGLL